MNSHLGKNCVGIFRVFSFTDIYKGDATLLDMYRDGHFIVIVHHLSQGTIYIYLNLDPKQLIIASDMKGG